MLTKDELEFLKSQGFFAIDVYDARKQSSAEWKAGVRKAGKILVLGTQCATKGHRLRTRSGHCAQCNTAKLGYQKRYNTDGYVYIAGSKSARLLKIGTCVDIDQRERNLRNQRYGNINDWEMLFTAKVDTGGKIEQVALSLLSPYRVVRMYDKDGKKQEAGEMLRTSFSSAFAALQEALKHAKASEARKSSKARDYEFVA